MTPEAVADWNRLEDRSPAYALVRDVDLVVIRYDMDAACTAVRCSRTASSAATT